MLPAALAAGLMAGCATTEPQLEDPVIIPEQAVAVDSINLYNTGESTRLNSRMLVLWVGRQPYLLTFDTPCYSLERHDDVMLLRTTGNQVYARFDSISFGRHLAGAPPQIVSNCRIDAIYRIDRADVDALKETLDKQGT
jgi:hypothetical protein